MTPQPQTPVEWSINLILLQVLATLADYLPANHQRDISMYAWTDHCIRCWCWHRPDFPADANVAERRVSYVSRFVHRLLHVLRWRAGTLLLAGPQAITPTFPYVQPFSALPAAQQELMLQRWARSRIPLLRKVHFLLITLRMAASAHRDDQTLGLALAGFQGNQGSHSLQYVLPGGQVECAQPLDVPQLCR